MAETPTYQAGDYGFVLAFEVGAAVDLAAVTEAFVRFWRIEDDTSAAESEIEVPGGIDAVNLKVFYTVAAGDIDTPGNYRAQVRLEGEDFTRRTPAVHFTVADNGPESEGG